MKIQELKKDLIGKGLCEKWTSEERWPEHADIEYVIRNVAMSMDGMEYIASSGQITPSMLIRIGGKLLEKYNLFVKKMTKIRLSVGNVKSHFVNCNCNVVIPYGFVGYVYVSHGSNVSLEVAANCDVRLSTYDNSTCTASVGYGSKVVWTKNGESTFSKL